MIVVDERFFGRGMEKTVTDTRHENPGDANNVLRELQEAVAEHEKILQRQEQLIRRLRDELKDVRR